MAVLVVVEHVLGSAIEALNLSRQRLNELGLVAPSIGNPVRFDAAQRHDATRICGVVVAARTPARLRRIVRPKFRRCWMNTRSRRFPGPGTKIRSWLEKAMQISARSFASAKDAQAAFGDLPDDVDVRVAESGRGLLDFPSETPPSPMPIPAGLAKPAATPDRSMAHRVAAPAAKTAATPAPARVLDSQEPPRRGLGRIAIWSIAAAGHCRGWRRRRVFVLPALRPQSPALKSVRRRRALTGPAVPSPAPVTAADADGVDRVDRIRRRRGCACRRAEERDRRRPESAAPAAAGPRFGGLTVTSPLELQVFAGGNWSDQRPGPSRLNEGPHSLEFVQRDARIPAPAVRQRQERSRMTSVKIAAPNGRISINAVPWAEVTIDGVRGRRHAAGQSVAADRHARDRVQTSAAWRAEARRSWFKVDGLLRVTQTFQQDKD
jgi:hypothetical protein